jgi:hypothetical protein
MTTVFDDSPEGSAFELDKRASFTIPSTRSSLVPSSTLPSPIPTSRFSQAVLEQQPPMTKKQYGSEILDRPLPEIPQRSRSLMHSRNASTASGAPSITPSLLPYLDRDSLSPPPYIGVAAVLPVRRSVDEELEGGAQVEGSKFVHAEDHDRYENPELKPPPLNPCKRKRTSSPPIGPLFSFPNDSMPNVTIRKNKKSPFKGLPKLLTSPDINNYGGFPVSRDDEDQDILESMTTLSLTESEWMCRTPSPVVHEASRVKRHWSPGVDKNRPSTKEGGSLRKKAMNWYENVRNSTEPESSPSNLSFGECKIKGGNWI